MQGLAHVPALVLMTGPPSPLSQSTLTNMPEFNGYELN